jgi:hypothetical protein
MLLSLLLKLHVFINLSLCFTILSGYMFDLKVYKSRSRSLLFLQFITRLKKQIRRDCLPNKKANIPSINVQFNYFLNDMFNAE